MLRRRRAAQINRQSIPYGSAKVEYLETSGTQTISLDKIEWGYNGRIKTDLMWTNLSAGGFQLPFFFAGGSKTSYINPDEAPDESDLIWRRWGIIGTLRWDYGADGKEQNTMQYGGSINQNVRYNIVKDGEKNYLDGRLVCSNGSATWNWKFYTKPRLGSDGQTYWFHGRYYYLLAIQDNKLMVNLIPSIDKTGTPCMFDLVSRKNFYNAGTGQFKYPPLSSNYTRIDYLESTGTQWIDTGVILKSNDFHFTIKYALLGSKQNERLLQGSNFTWVCSLAGNGYAWINLPKKDGGRIGGEFHLIHTKGEPIILEFKAEEVIKNGTKLDINASMSQITNYDSLQDTNISLKLCSFGDPTQYTSERFVGKIFNLKLDINEINHNFVPCLDPTGTPCMFDTVTKKPFYNSGTGDFLYPSPTSSATYSMRRPQAEYAKMMDTGVRRLYHVPVGYEGSIEEYASENGFKLLNETESPNEEGKYYAFRWVETDTEIMTEWYETEPPTDEFGQVIENNNEQQSTTFNLRRPAPIDNTVYSNNAQWAKITDTGVHKIYHTPIGYEGSLEEYAIENGYKRLIETESPNEEGKYYSFKWVETDDTLTTEWFEIDPPQEEIIEENLDNPME